MRKIAVLLDFDGTVTDSDIGASIVRKFGLPGWDDGMRRYGAGEFSVGGLLAWETAHLPVARRREMIDYALSIARLRPGLRGLVDYARASAMPVEIVSAGWDFYIREILKRNGLGDVSFRAPVAVFGAGPGAGLEFPQGAELCARVGLCKCARVRAFQGAGFAVVYAGDGISDFCVAREADLVLARRELAGHCRREGIDYVPFEDMHDVLSAVRRLASGALSLPPAARRSRAAPD